MRSSKPASPTPVSEPKAPMPPEYRCRACDTLSPRIQGDEIDLDDSSTDVVEMICLAAHRLPVLRCFRRCRTICRAPAQNTKRSRPALAAERTPWPRSTLAERAGRAGSVRQLIRGCCVSGPAPDRRHKTAYRRGPKIMVPPRSVPSRRLVQHRPSESVNVTLRWSLRQRIEETSRSIDTVVCCPGAKLPQPSSVIDVDRHSHDRKGSACCVFEPAAATPGPNRSFRGVGGGSRRRRSRV